MTEFDGQYPTVIGSDAKFKGDLSFDKGVRIEGQFEGRIKSQGTLCIAEGGKVSADVEASNVRLEGECRGNLTVTEKLHLLATAKVEGDVRTTRLEIADGAIFSGNVIVGQAAAEAARRQGAVGAHGDAAAGQPRRVVQPTPQPQPQPQAQPGQQAAYQQRPRPQEMPSPTA